MNKKQEKAGKQKTKKTIDKKVEASEKELNENIKKLEKEIVHKKELPKEEEEKINKMVFENIVIAIVIMVFLNLISLGSINIETSVFLTDLKVFSILLIIATILLFEYSYRKENGKLCIHGIECFFLALFTLLSIYLYTIYFNDFQLIVASVAFIFAIYYVGKAIFKYNKMKKEYFESINDISEIIKK